MKNKRVQLVLSDIDGTILDDNHQVDTQLARAVSKLKAADIPFILASARSPKGIRPLAQALNTTDWPLACYNGALLIKENREGMQEVISSHGVDLSEASLLIDILKVTFPSVYILEKTGMSKGMTNG